MSTTADDRLLTAAEVAERLGDGITEEWVRDQSRKGRIPSVKLGRYRRYRPSSIDRWIAGQEQGGE